MATFAPNILKKSFHCFNQNLKVNLTKCCCNFSCVSHFTNRSPYPHVLNVFFCIFFKFVLVYFFYWAALQSGAELIPPKPSIFYMSYSSSKILIHGLSHLGFYSFHWSMVHNLLIMNMATLIETVNEKTQGYLFYITDLITVWCRWCTIKTGKSIVRMNRFCPLNLFLVHLQTALSPSPWGSRSFQEFGAL